MRPHRLVFRGIGPYPDKVTVDFDSLGQMGLYLIVGPTGGGKSTLFDAMTFALFGKTASGREGSIASNFAHSDRPEIEFEFSHKGRTFLAHREPGTQTHPATPNKQWIREIDPSGREVRTVTQTRNVNKFVEDTLGLDADQFMKVILLPQGQFMDFLMATSTEKAPLLKAIFGTHLYGHVAERMEDRARTLKDKAADSGRRLQEQRASATAVVTNLVEEGLGDDLPDPDEDLAGLIAVLAGRADAARTERQKALEHYDKQAARFTTVSLAAERFDAAKDLSALKALASSRARHVERAKGELADHERALRVADADVALGAARGHREIAEAAERTGRSDLQRLLAKLKLADGVAEILRSAVPTATPATLQSEHQKLHAKVSSAAEQFEEVADLDDAIRGHTGDLKRATGDRDGAERGLAKSQDAIARVSASLVAARTAERRLVSLEREIGRLDDLLAQADVAGAKADLVRAQVGADKADTAFRRADEAASRARAERTRHLAGELAVQLEKNEPCPVCGSTHHPAKARPTAEVDIDVKEEQKTKAWGRKVAADAKLDEAAEAVKKAMQAKDRLPPPRQQSTLRADYDKAVAAADSIEELEERESELRDEIEDAKAMISDAKERITVATKALTGDTKRRDDLAAKAAAVGTRRNVEAALDLLDEADELLGDLEEAVSTANEARTGEAAAKKNLDKVLKSEKFPDAKDALARILDDERISELEEELADDAERAERIAVLTGKVGTEPVPKTRPDPETAREAMDVSQTAMTIASDTEIRLSQAGEMLDTCRRSIDALGPEVERDQERSRQAQRIATVFKRGAGSGDDAQLGLETWVQRTFFEEVCEVATEQMRVLSSNRYILTLESEGGIKKKRAGGLDLYVLDSHTGMTRPVGTLSGGERFQTSLALALALAEVVQRHAGGIELSALFIDEGFGSLDDESLDDAINVLKKLNDVGRTVGVITHVERMKEELPVGIRVRKGASGSELELVAN